MIQNGCSDSHMLMTCLATNCCSAYSQLFPPTFFPSCKDSSTIHQAESEQLQPGTPWIKVEKHQFQLPLPWVSVWSGAVAVM